MILTELAGTQFYIDIRPDECPRCHHAIVPVPHGGVLVGHDPMGKTEADLFFQCTHRDCRHGFLGRYGGEYTLSLESPLLRLLSTSPLGRRDPDLPEEVIKLSPDFRRIFSEAQAAETYKLKEIAGVGYRKALEFLVKDFCIAEHPDKAEAIKKEWLGAVIRDYIENPVLEAVAERATWLGNDETHYVRFWEDKDLTDLKGLIALTVSHINTHQLGKKYIAEMPEKGSTEV